MPNVVHLRTEEPTSPLTIAADGHHMVHFYESEPDLFRLVGRFLRAGLDAGDRVVVVATAEHVTGFRAELGASWDEAHREARLVVLDARETLARLMVDGAPSRARFDALLAEVMSPQAGAGAARRVRIYGEVVDLLYREGDHHAAVLLEKLWTEAGSKYPFALLCAYVMGSFVSNTTERLAEVCDAHTHVVSSDKGPDGRAIELPELRDRVQSLEVENRELRTFDQALRASKHEQEARFKLLVESVKDYAMFMLDPSGVVTTWNAGAERIKGYRADEIIGRHFSTFYPASDVEAGKCEHELTVAAEVGRFEDEGFRIRKDGSRFWANVVITALRDASGTLVGFGKVTRDLTERVAAERERLYIARMEEAERRKNEFLAVVGHELRNPLAPLVTAAHMIRLRGGRATEKEMGILDRQLRQMTKIVSDLLDASRSIHDKVTLSPVNIEIGEILANAVDLASPLLEERHHELVIDVPGRGLTVNVDPERMAQVFGNVLNNAAKYTPPGGKITLGASREGDDVIVTVDDTGQGIAPDDLRRIFDLFEQGEQGLARTTGGLGIGLAIARRLVREHRGSIAADSDGLGKGSRFTIRLPHVTVEPRAVGLPAPAPLSQSVRRRILVADDNRDAAEMMQALLEDAGHTTRVAFDGDDALRIAKEWKPDVVFLDIGLPGMDGYEVARRMRADAQLRGAAIVAISGYARDEDRARALASGFENHLAKPVDVAGLVTILERLPV